MLQMSIYQHCFYILDVFCSMIFIDAIGQILGQYIQTGHATYC